MLSVAHLTALDLSPEEFLTAAAAAGFEGVGLRILPPPHTPEQWPVAGDRARTRALRQRADDLGIRVLEVEGFPIGPGGSVAGMEIGLEAAAELGATFILGSGNEPDEELLTEGYGILCDAAARFGLTVGMEFMPFRPMATLADALRVRDKVGRTNGRVLVDTLHLSRSGGTAEQLAAVPSSALAYIHLCDAPAVLPDPGRFADEARTARLFPGEGALPLAAIVRAHPSLDLSIEAPHARHAHLPGAMRIALAGKAASAFLTNLQMGHSC